MERVQFCGKPAKKEIFAEAVEKVKPIVEKMALAGNQITEFEALTAAAFLCFKELGAEIAVLEVGLGGRLDATNVIDVPLVNIITSLSLDHTAILGNTLSEIAFEKCGTIKKNGTVVCSASQKSEALAVIEKICTEKRNELLIPDMNGMSVVKSDIYGTEFSYKGNNYFVTMPGAHQLLNMTSVIEACGVLEKKGFFVSESNIFNGIKQTVLPARVEVLLKKPLVILDGGHNEDGAKAFYNTLLPELSEKGQLLVIVGMMADKDVEKSLYPLLKISDKVFTVTPKNPRSMSATELSVISRKYCKNVITAENASEAINQAFSELAEKDILVVVGSLYLAGEVRRTLKEFCEQIVNNYKH